MATRVEKIQHRWQRITPRERSLIVVLGGTAILIILSWVAHAIGAGLTELEEQTSRKQNALAALRHHQANASGGQDKSPKIEIPEEAVELRGYLNRVATQVGVKIPSYSRRPKAKKGEFVELSTGIEVRGLTIEQVKGLLSGIEKDPKVVITSLRIKRAFRDKDKLDIELVVATYEKGKGKQEEDSPKEG